jgi:hypothetical protein
MIRLRQRYLTEDKNLLCARRQSEAPPVTTLNESWEHHDALTSISAPPPSINCALIEQWGAERLDPLQSLR